MLLRKRTNHAAICCRYIRRRLMALILLSAKSLLPAGPVHRNPLQLSRISVDLYYRENGRIHGRPSFDQFRWSLVMERSMNKRPASRASSRGVEYGRRGYFGPRKAKGFLVISRFPRVLTRGAGSTDKDPRTGAPRRLQSLGRCTRFPKSCPSRSDFLKKFSHVFRFEPWKRRKDWISRKTRDRFHNHEENEHGDGDEVFVTANSRN